MTAPDRIWTSKCGRALVTIHPRWADDVEYIRAELAAPAALSPIAGRTLDEWTEFARRDDCLEHMVPSDLRQLLAALRGIGGGNG